MDIFAVASSGTRLQDLSEPGKAAGGDAFASLLGEITGSKAEAPRRGRREEEPEEMPAAEATAAAQSQDRRSDSDHAKSGAAKDSEEAARAGGSATDKPASAQGTAANQPGGEASTAQAAGAQAATSGPVTDAQLVGHALQAAGQSAFRLPGQPQGLRGEIHLEKNGQGPRNALAGGTALAASLAASSQGGVQAEAGLGGEMAGDGLGAAARNTPRTTEAGARGFAAMAADAAGQLQGGPAATKDSGNVAVLQAPTDGDILLPAGTEPLRGEASQPAQAAAIAGRTAAPLPHAPLADQVAVQLHRAIGIGRDRLTIQLNPADLGQLEIKLELGRDGPVRAVLAADKPETMELLQRDARGLERALQNAGLQTDSNSISFDLRGGQQQRSGQGFAQAQAMPNGAANGQSGDGGDGQPQPARAEAQHDGNVNIRV